MSRYDGLLRPSDVSEGAVEAVLPPSGRDNHAANLCLLPSGDLLCVWFTGSGEGNPDTHIVMSRVPAGGTRWTNPVVLSEDPTRSEQNPVLFQVPSGGLWLLHTANQPHDSSTAEVLLRVSSNEGQSFSPTRVLFSEPGTFIRHPPVLLPGRWLLPIYRAGSSFVMISENQGESWREVAVPASQGRVQMSIVSLPDGQLFAVFRSREADWIYQSISLDGGETWSEPTPTELPNNNSSVQLTTLSDGRLLLAFNNVSGSDVSKQRRSVQGDKVVTKPGRTPLTVALSEDGGKTWPLLWDIQVEDEAFYRSKGQQYSYPSIVAGPDGWIHLAYSYLREAIKYVRFPESALERI